MFLTHRSISLEVREMVFTVFRCMHLQPVVSLKEEKKSLIILKSSGEMWLIPMI